MNLVLINCNGKNLNFYKTMLYFVYKYVNFIVDQGAAIVTNLEHLKFFFLSNTNNVGKYNNNQIDSDGYIYDEAKYLCESEDSCKNLVTNDRYYIKKTLVSPAEVVDGKQLEALYIDEKINMGKMQDFRLLPILQNLANQNYNLSELKTKKYDNENTLDLFNSIEGATFVSDPNKKKSLFVMFTNIKIFRDTKPAEGTKHFDSLTAADMQTNPDFTTIVDGLCTAELDTLEFAQSISSTTQTGGQTTARTATRRPPQPVQQVTTQPVAATTASVARRPTTPAQSTRLRAAQSRRETTIRGGSLNNNNITYQKFDMKALTKNHKRPKTHRNYKKTIKKSNKNNNQVKKHLARHSKKYNN